MVFVPDGSFNSENLIFMFSERFAVRLVDFIFSVSIGQKSGFFFLPDMAM